MPDPGWPPPSSENDDAALERLAELFPRDQEYMPGWLRHKVGSARGSL